MTRAFKTFVAKLAAFRRQHEAIARAAFYKGKVDAFGDRDVVWLNGTGGIMSRDEWHDPKRRSFGSMVRTHNGALLLLFNNDPHQACEFVLPDVGAGDLVARV